MGIYIETKDKQKIKENIKEFCKQTMNVEGRFAFKQRTKQVDGKQI